LNYKNKLLSLKEYISSYNFCLENYYSSELKFATNDEIGQNSFNKIFDLAYLRGRIFAHELNYEIQKRTKQTYDLDKYIKYLFNVAEKDDKFKFSMETIIETLFSLTGYNFRYFIENFLIKNNLNVNAKYILNNKNISLIKKKSIFIYHGFDYLKTNLTWKISGVKLGSKEYSSGLRNGQSVLSISESSNIDDYTIFKIDYGKSSRDIMIRPRYKKVYISQYENTRN
jgi:predicted metalloprotease with PDZ domain